MATQWETPSENGENSAEFSPQGIFLQYNVYAVYMHPFSSYELFSKIKGRRSTLNLCKVSYEIFA